MPRPPAVWSPEEDAVLMGDGSLREISAILGRTIPACKTRRRFLRAIDAKDYEYGVQASAAFLDALRAGETPPTELPIPEGRAVYAPTGYQGSGCSSPANMD